MLIFRYCFIFVYETLFTMNMNIYDSIVFVIVPQIQNFDNLDDIWTIDSKGKFQTMDILNEVSCLLLLFCILDYN